MIIDALHYAGLVGKYIRMERLSNVEELASTGDQTVGMEALVAAVQDDGNDVIVIGDYGEVWRITGRDAPDWTFTIWANEEAATKSRERPHQLKQVP
jgi:hypothetical protein